MECIGQWAGVSNETIIKIIEYARLACLRDVRLVSDRQPQRLRVDNHTSGPPAIWLHNDPQTTAWTIVDIAGRAWCQLAYQFGHELGHVLANSWNAAALPRQPCQWLEETLVEAFSLRGLGRLAESWARHPPFNADEDYSLALMRYKTNLVVQYSKPSIVQPFTSVGEWFGSNRQALEHLSGLNDRLGPVILAVLDEYEQNSDMLADIGALNRWPERSAVPLELYLEKWHNSCRELGAPGLLPLRLGQILSVGPH